MNGTCNRINNPRFEASHEDSRRKESADEAGDKIHQDHAGKHWMESLRIAPLAFIDNEMFYVSKVWANAGLGLLFAFLGSWKTIRNLAKETKGEIFQIEPI